MDKWQDLLFRMCGLMDERLIILEVQLPCTHARLLVSWLVGLSVGWLDGLLSCTSMLQSEHLFMVELVECIDRSDIKQI